jgi:hypothetical protein
LSKYESRLEETGNKFTDLFFFNRFKTIQSTCVFLFEILLDAKNPLPYLNKVLSKEPGFTNDEAEKISRRRIEALEAENKSLNEKNRSYVSEIWTLKNGMN